MPVGALDFHDGLRMGAEIYHFLRQILNEEGLSTAVGDEGGFAPDVKDTREVFRYLQKAVEKAGYHVGDDVVLPWMQRQANCMTRRLGYTFSRENPERQEKSRKRELEKALQRTIVKTV